MRKRRAGLSSWSVPLALAAAQAGFALFPIFGKLALVSIPPFVIAAIRVALAAAMLEIVRRTAPVEPVRREDRRLLMLLAILGVSLNQVLFIVGLSLTSAINTTILISSIPAFTLAAAALLGREALTPRAVVGTLLAGA
ncbi:MAG: EamA family transporter, partial [Acidobacteriota bacterium]